MEETKTKKGLNKKWIEIIALVAVVAIVACVLIVRGLSKKEQGSVFCIYDEEQNITAVYINEKLVDTIEGQFSSFERNMNDTGLYLTDDESTLYYVSNSKINKIGEKLTLITIANFSKEALVLDEDGNLCLCNGKGIEVITDKDVSFATISGNGKTYAFSSEGDSYFGKKPGKEKKVSDVVIAYISNDAKCMYALSMDDSTEENLWEKMYYYYCYYSQTTFDLYHVDKKGNKELVKEDLATIDGLNADGTEIMFSTDTETYVCVNGGSATKVSDNVVQSINYENSENISYGHFNAIDSFKDSICIFYDDDMNSFACRITNGYKAENIVENCATVMDVDSKLSKFIYLNDEAEMYYAKVEKDADAKCISESVIDGKMSLDGEHIYYVTIGESMELHYVDKDMQDEMVKEFDDYWAITVVNDECYLETDETYYVSGVDCSKIEEEGYLFLDSITQTVYWNGYESINKLEAGKLVKLKGDYNSISSYDVAK